MYVARYFLLLCCRSGGIDVPRAAVVPPVPRPMSPGSITEGDEITAGQCAVSLLQSEPSKYFSRKDMSDHLSKNGYPRMKENGRLSTYEYPMLSMFLLRGRYGKSRGTTIYFKYHEPK